jgi:hypothetical protein
LQVRSENKQAADFYADLGYLQDDVIWFGKRLDRIEQNAQTQEVLTQEREREYFTARPQRPQRGNFCLTSLRPLWLVVKHYLRLCVPA